MKLHLYIIKMKVKNQCIETSYSDWIYNSVTYSLSFNWFIEPVFERDQVYSILNQLKASTTIYIPTPFSI